MTEHGYLYTDALALRIHQGRKGATRRPFGVQNTIGFAAIQQAWAFGLDEPIGAESCRVKVGDTMWVRECWEVLPNSWCLDRPMVQVRYRADGSTREVASAAGRAWMEADGTRCRRWPSMHMPRWATRSVRVVTSVHAERLEPLSQAEAEVEGFDSPEEFTAVWDAVYGGKGMGMIARPWVWCIRWE